MGVEILLIEYNQDDLDTMLNFFHKYRITDRLLSVKTMEKAINFFLQLEQKTIPKLAIIASSPDNKGIDMVRWIRQCSEFKTTPIVLLSNSEAEKEVIESYTLSVIAYIRKPINLVKFKRIVSLAGIPWEYFKQFD